MADNLGGVGKTVTEVIQDTVRRYGGRACDINEGECEIFSEILVRALDANGLSGAWQGSNWDHSWVVYQGRYYDAETPNGVGNPRDLPFFHRHPDLWGTPMKQLDRDLVAFYRQQPESIKEWVQKEINREAMLKILNRLATKVEKAAGPCHVGQNPKRDHCTVATHKPHGKPVNKLPPKVEKPKEANHFQLSPEDEKINQETQAIAKAEYPRLKQEYLQKNGTFTDGKLTSVVLNTDDWRSLFPQYTGTNSAAVHAASSACNKKLLAEALETMKGIGNNKFVVLAGGGGSGKGTVTGIFLDEKQYPIRLDQVSDEVESVLEKLDKSASHGYTPEYVFIDRYPEDAWAGVVGRAVRAAEKGELPRTVPLEIAAKANIHARKAAIAIFKGIK